MSRLFSSWRTSLAGVAGLLTGASQLVTVVSGGLPNLSFDNLALPISLISGSIGLFMAKDHRQKD